MERDFTADRPGVKFVGDTAYIHTWAGFIYLATVSDCYSKKVVGWSIADHMRTELVETALKNAAATSVIEPLAVFHSDRGSVDRLNSPSSGPGPLPASAPLRAAVVASAPGGRVRGTRSVGASVLGALRRHHLVFRDPRG